MPCSVLMCRMPGVLHALDPRIYRRQAGKPDRLEDEFVLWKREVEQGKPSHARIPVAEREGFEPSIRFCRILTFQASAFDHSATAPHALEGEAFRQGLAQEQAGRGHRARGRASASLAALRRSRIRAPRAPIPGSRWGRRRPHGPRRCRRWRARRRGQRPASPRRAKTAAPLPVTVQKPSNAALPTVTRPVRRSAVQGRCHDG